MLRECIYGECAHEQHVRRTLTLTITHTITAYSVSGNVVRVRILICATRQKPCRKKFTFFLSSWSSNTVRVEKRTFVIFSTRALGEHRPPPRRVRSGFGVRIRTRNADSDIRTSYISWGNTDEVRIWSLSGQSQDHRSKNVENLYSRNVKLWSAIIPVL